MSGLLTHFEIHASEPEKLIAFYTAIFGWEFKKWEGGQMEYWMIMGGKTDTNGALNGGLVRRMGKAPEKGAPVNGYVCTMVVEDFDATAKKIMDAGGVVALPKMALVGMAWQGYFIDPDNNIFGLHQTDKNAK